MTVNFLLEQLEWVRNESADGPNTITVEARKHNGSWDTDYYDQIINIVVRLEPRGGAQHFVLANCHFDSVPGSPGANDDAVGCAVMLEVLHSISNLSIPLNHGIIFLFNGAEEIGLLASHAFVTQHELVKQIRAFVNLVACSVGRKELVFQTGPENPWLVQAYADAVKHPFASVVGQEVFQSNVIPSDTDFRIFTKIDNIPGIDLAFIENGYLYHTKYDTADRILTDSIQRAGDNILALLKHLVAMEILADPSEYRNGSMVFFDVLGLTMVVYTAQVGSIINYVVAVATLIYLAKKCLWPREVWGWDVLELLCGSFVFVLSWVMAVLTVLGVAWVVTRMGCSMFWFTHFYASICLYGSVAAGKILLIHTLARILYYRVKHIQHAQNKQRLKLSDLFFDISLLLWCCALIFLTQRGLCSAYVPMLMVFFSLATKLLLCRHFAQKGVSKTYMLFYLLGLSLPCIHLLYLIWIVFEVFTPIMGRFGNVIPPDLIALIAVTTALLSSFLIHFLYLASSTKHALAALYTTFVLMFVLVSCGVFFPYSGDPTSPRPKRVKVQHFTSTCHALNGSLEKTDSGYQIDSFDYIGMSHITPHIPDINDTTRRYELPFCGFNKLFFSTFKNTFSIPAPAVSPKSPLEFKLVSKNILTRGTVRLSFEANGPSNMDMYIMPHPGFSLAGCSFANMIKYHMKYIHGMDAGPWTFWIEVKPPSEYLEDNDMVSITITAHYLFGEDQQTPDLSLFLQKFPDWACVTSQVVLQRITWPHDGDEDDCLLDAKHLESITSVGPRPVGSAENEIMTVNFLLEQLEWVRNESVDGPNNITVEARKHNGSWLFNYYDQIINVVVRLEPRGGAQHFVLANCHFDSVPGSRGANDDAVSCAVMLEVLHSISNLSIPLNHGIIFLFNGAEEIGLLASHAFVTQNELVRQIRAFVNLEACGVGGKELVFQIGPENPWLAQAYADAVKHPFGSVVGQEVFQSNVIPSYTDFRTFTKIANIPGIDLAFIENGYLYHTKYDTADRILTDSIQRAGDNILALLKHLVTMEILADPSEYRNGSMVFFDVLGLTMVVYTARVGSIINYVVAIATLIYLAKKCLWPREVWGWYVLELLCGSFVFVLSWVMAVLTVLGVAWVVTRMGRSMFWFTHFYASICLYGSVAAGKILLIHTLARILYYRVKHIQHVQNKQRLKLSDLFFDVSLLLWCCGLIFLTQRGLCSAYVPMLMVFFSLATKLLLCRHFTQKGVSKTYMLFYLLGLSLPCIHLLYLIWIVFEVFTPIMGRFGNDIPPDFVIAALIAIATALLSSFLIHFLYLASSTKHALAALYTTFVLMFVLVSCGVFFPYSGDPTSPRPKRVEVQHFTRTCHALNGSLEKTDSGYQIDSFDYTGLSHITPHFPDINDTTRSYELPFCGFNKLLFSTSENTLYLPASAVSLKSPLEFKLVSKNISTQGTVRFSFEAKGPSHMTLVVQPHRGHILKSWPLAISRGYFISYTRGVDAGPWTFWIEVLPSSEYLEGNSLVSIMISAHYLFGEDQHTPELNLFLQNFPDWAFVTSQVSTYHVYKY